MSEEKMAIEFAINSMELADVIRNYSSEQMNAYDANESLDLDFSSFVDADYDGTVYTNNNIVIGSLIASDYDEMWDGWRPVKPIPEGKDVIKWIAEVICRGDYGNKIAKEGIEYINNNAESLEKSLKKYKIIHVEIMPYAESNVHYEEYDGERHVAYRMYPDNWKKMWDASCREEAGAIFEKHQHNMNFYSLKDGIAGDIFNDLYNKPLFMELLKLYGDVKILDVSTGSATRVSSGIKNSSYSFFETREANLDTIDFNKKTICAGTLSFFYDENENAFYGNAGTPFDIAKKVIEHLGGKTTKTVSPKTDYIVVPEYLSLLGERSYLYDGYKDELKGLKKSVTDADKKRVQKNLPKIAVIKEENLYDWLRAKYEELKATTELFRPYGEIRIVLLPKDKNAYTNFTFRAEAFYNIHIDQMEKAASGLESLSEFISNIEDMTEKGIFSKSGVKKNDYTNAISMDEKYKWYVDYRAIKFSYESSNGISYDIRKKY